MLQGKFQFSRQKESHAQRDESPSQEGRKYWSTVAQLGQGARAEATGGCQVDRNQTRMGLWGPFSISEKGRFLEIDAAWII